ncbi:prepilin peptidase [Oharaeibacter diazotrophicus]|uniref:General secretion pathway protein O/leader peptidase (Prepilin peptidase)/N-methyltransferase n=1 Tax=Oharaeibacter diazotrophicus TaxID=1920512 RepID=A0A4R6R6H9_9HYPH|nr:prepilin peptidase [Oharaeibacter diazotrophicus]TDP81442.1 general secretion pathway protein O/leader peptidase (prepilin peptidase)/N-methyltransferase [Oharaeibacter diazotrophicus]BBE73680.1 type IV leader peptidase family protein [Pleomorphomonas sp. SM30]GLS75469.1 hypothetical protein GCM10007904_08040 [Oharaeibacter diazotrophicus]
MADGAGLRDLVGATLAALAAVAVVLAAGGGREAVAVAAVVALTAWVAVEDAASFTIPDGAVVGLALVGAAVRLADARAFGLPLADEALRAAVEVALTGGALWLVREIFYRRRGFDGLGFGDVKLGAAGGVLVGAPGFAAALAAASAAGVAVLLVRHGRSQSLRAEKLAFGTLLAPALALVFALARLAPDVLPGGLAP